MPLSYIVQYSTDNLTWTTLSNVQDININIGRQAMLDQYSASTASLTIRYPSGYASPIADMVSGTYIRIQSPNTTDPVYSAYFGVIKDVNVRYGIPYAGSVGNADYLNVSIEGFFAAASRMQGNSYAMSAGLLSAQVLDMLTETLIDVFYGFNPQMGAATISSSWGDWLNSVLVTLNGRMTDSQGLEGIILKGPFNQSTCTVNFSDVANNATNQVYDQVTFGSLSDNFYTQVTVDPASFAPQTVTKSGAVKPYRTYQVNTLSASTSQALDQANFLLSQYETQKFALTSVSCLAEAQTFFKLDKMGLSQLGEIIGSRVSVTFRGTVYQSIVEGITVTATPESSRYTYYLSGADLNNYLILDNAVFGKLDFNKLGY